MGESDRSSISVVGSSLGTSRAAEPRKGIGLAPKAYQELKSTVHRDLLSRVDLEKVMSLGDGAARSQIFSVIQDLVGGLNTPLSGMERQQLARVVLKDDAHLMQIIERIVSAVGRRVDESTPMVDARLADGSRVNAIIPPLAIDGPSLSIRRFGHVPLQPDDLLANHTLTPQMLELLKGAIKARLNIVISGGTGSGKTTMLNCLSGFIPERERIVTIEDSAELLLKQDHVVRLECRPPNVEGKGAVKARQLVINSLRMRPDRIVVGEVRGEECLDMLQAMNTGHDGSLTTVHANSPRDALSRMETMSLMANLNLPEKAIRSQIASAVTVILQVSRMSDGTRRVTHFTEITGMDNEVVSMQDIFLFEKRGIGAGGLVLGRFYATGIRPKFADKLKTSGITVPAALFDHSVEI